MIGEREEKKPKCPSRYDIPEPENRSKSGTGELKKKSIASVPEAAPVVEALAAIGSDPSAAVLPHRPGAKNGITRVQCTERSRTHVGAICCALLGRRPGGLAASGREGTTADR